MLPWLSPPQQRDNTAGTYSSQNSPNWHAVQRGEQADGAGSPIPASLVLAVSALAVLEVVESLEDEAAGRPLAARHRAPVGDTNKLGVLLDQRLDEGEAMARFRGHWLARSSLL